MTYWSGKKDKFGRVWFLPRIELCSTCGQPDNVGDCTHVRLTTKQVRELQKTRVKKLPKVTKDPNKNWLNNDIQFPRLLAELRAIGLTNAQYKDLFESMDLSRSEIDDILERAERAWTIIKEITASK